ncbi:MAG: ArnT family glycosyltransferase [Anaerolineales bacterium]
MRSSKAFLYYLIALSLIGGGLVLLTTSLYGAGVSADAAKNMSTAESLLAGRGFFDHAGGALTYWPPLYPLLLAGLSGLTGWDVFVIGWYLNVLLMVVNVFLAGRLIYEALRDKPLYAYLGALFVLGSESTLRIHSNVSSDPLYITFSLIFLLATNRYMGKKSARALWVMIVSAALAMLQRWLGASLVVMGGLVILVANWKDWRRVLRDGALLALSLLPVGSWIYFHNIRQFHTFWGNDSPPLSPWANFEFSLTKMMHWFMPYHPRLEFLLFHPLLVVGVLLVLLLLIARRQEWTAWWQALRRPNVFPVVFFLPLSLVGLSFTIVTGDHLDPYSDRYYVGFLASVIVFLFITLDTLVLARLRIDLAKSRSVLAVLFGVWFLVYPSFSIYKYVSVSLVNGETSNYNYYNNRTFNENPAIPVVKKLIAEHPDAYFYSNYADGVWFFTRRSAPLMPRSSLDMNMSEIEKNYAGWPDDKPGYILWFLPNEFKHVVPPDLLAEIADVQLVFSSDRGLIYSVQAKP